LSRFLGSLLFQVSPTDPPTFAAGTVVLSVVAVLAALLPARRAAMTDPMTALRNE
jgi:ABC-type lipoprotein release transport system permease subunit